jgi:hypothetical protein
MSSFRKDDICFLWKSDAARAPSPLSARAGTDGEKGRMRLAAEVRLSIFMSGYID